MEQNLSSPIRILIADDYEGWRRQVRSIFRAQSQWEVTAEAADGLEAIQKVEELKPDLIVLDIGLPKLNGIEVARRIRQLSPNSIIVVLSQNNDLDVVLAALGAGVRGYVYKADLPSDLLHAVESVLRGENFVSTSLKGYEFTDTSGRKASNRHEVLLYSSDAVFLDALARFIAVALKSGQAAIVVISESHRDGLVLRLETSGLDIEAASRQGTYIQLDAGKATSAFMVDGMPDAARVFELLRGLIESAAKATRQEHPRVVACGECAPVLWAEGKADAAIRLEQLWDEVGKTLGLDTLCGYALSSFHGGEDEQVFQSICAEHSAVCSR
jgi:DNA-binding NarL/FixJ family response regulator